MGQDQLIMMENKKISYKKYIGLAAVIFVVVLVTSNFDAAFSQNNTDEAQNLNLTGSDPLTTLTPLDLLMALTGQILTQLIPLSGLGPKSSPFLNPYNFLNHYNS